jgi:hypothetical protein
MERVFAIAEQPIDDSLFVAVAIGEPEPNQRHVGILHRTANSTHFLLHLAWHCILKNEAVLPDYFRLWAVPTIEPVRLRTVAAVCRRVWRKNAAGGLPYAFSSPEDSFDAATGALLLGPSRFGLTCASFVFGLFQAAGLQLALYGEWPQGRSGDQEWQEAMIEKLTGRADAEHIDHLRTEIGAARYRPEEVAAAAALAPPPAPFEKAAALGEQIVARLQQPAKL